MIDAYKWFKAIDGVRIFAIKEKIKLLNNVTVNFVYKEKFIGEMQFQFLKQTKKQEEKYHANHFIYELERAKEKIELLGALNKKAAFMSKHNKLVAHG